MTTSRSRRTLTHLHEVLMSPPCCRRSGSETTLISNGLVALHDHPDQWQRIVNDQPDSCSSQRSTAIRHTQPPAKRTPTRPVEKHGVTMNAGDWVLLLLGSANRDERRYDSPDRFIINRPRGIERLLRLGYPHLSRSMAGAQGGTACVRVRRQEVPERHRWCARTRPDSHRARLHQWK